jgi:hypothetical protein
MGIVRMTSKSVYDDNPENALRNVTDLSADLFFRAQVEPGQWVCWAFGKLRALRTHYSITSDSLLSWVVEG